ncbi:hypothetical protein [Paenibacillus hubeiensis]|uniref:hypothetical protein n=1 Tax=Paenibacillus hubeiensis TaxID=3077330 RepID=UPI0031BA8403
MNKKKLIICVVLLCSVVVGCDAIKPEGQYEPTIQTEVKNEPKTDIYTYEEYEALVQEFSEVVHIPNYTLKNIPLIKSLVIVEKELTFDKRQSLTVNGDTSDMRPTQQIYIYENKDQSTQIQVRIGYTKNYLDKDLVIWDSSKGFEKTNSGLSKNTDVATFLYKNLVISITVNAEKDASIVTMRAAMKEIVDFFKNI